MAREIIIRCERHADRTGQECRIDIPEGSVIADLCDECRQPLIDITRIGRPVSNTGPIRVPSSIRGLESRIRGVPEMDGSS